jgi:hypothetical protein
MWKRRRVKQTETLEARLAAQAEKWREEAKRLPPGEMRDLLLKRARQADAAAHMSDWLSSPGLQSPT